MAEPTEDPLQETGKVLGSALRTGAVAAGELVRMHLLRQAHRDHEATRAAQLEARALAERLKAERPLAAVLYRPTRDPAWWDKATTTTSRGRGTRPAPSPRPPRGEPSRGVLRGRGVTSPRR